MSRKNVIEIIGLLFAVLALIFGGNVYEQITGHSVFQPPPTQIIETTKDFQLIPTPRFTPTAKSSILTPDASDYIDSKNIPMRLVPAGLFTMGNDRWAEPNEKPVHEVYLDAFYIDKFEVTNLMYKSCVEAKVCAPPKETWSWSRSNYYDNSEYAYYPVIHVDWMMAQSYCKWRGAKLPTEAQWEKAARGTDERAFPAGHINCDLANYHSCLDDTTEVGTYVMGASPYGVYDMAGNVAEWVEDWYDDSYYLNSPSSNPEGPASGETRVQRGGSYSGGIGADHTSYGRDSDDPDKPTHWAGFRCARFP